MSKRNGSSLCDATCNLYWDIFINKLIFVSALAVKGEAYAFIWSENEIFLVDLFGKWEEIFWILLGQVIEIVMKFDRILWKFYKNVLKPFIRNNFMKRFSKNYNFTLKEIFFLFLRKIIFFYFNWFWKTNFF